MRIRFAFDCYLEDFPDIHQFETWVDDFPCRLYNGDMIEDAILGEGYTKIVPKHTLYLPIVDSNQFDIDEKGIYQYVWLTVEG